MHEMTCAFTISKESVDVKAMRGGKQDTYTTIFNFFSSGLHASTSSKTDVTAVFAKPGLPFLVAGTRRGEVPIG
jgi:hypothetical protein